MTASVSRVDADHGNTLAAYKAMGSPVDPTEEQAEKLNRETALQPGREERLQGGHLDLTLKPNALALVELKVVH